MNVKVIDRSMPVFDKQFYTDSVLESIEVHSPLALSIQAESPLSRKLIYSITKGNDFEEFALDFNTGEREHFFVTLAKTVSKTVRRPWRRLN